MSDFSDDSCENESHDNEPKYRRLRKSKLVSYKALFNSDDESDDIEETQHDSDKDPDFKCTDDDDSASSNDDEESFFSDGGYSAISNKSELQKTLNMINDPFGVNIDVQTSGVSNVNETATKTVSKRKMSIECQKIYGLATQNLWDHNYDEALKQCFHIIKQFPSYSGSYEILAEIYEHRGQLKNASKMYHRAAWCEPRDIEKWRKSIDKAKEFDGIEKATEVAKKAVARTLSRELREVLVELLEEGGHEQLAMVKRLINMHGMPPAASEEDASMEAEQLAYMSEKFEAWGNPRRASECLELLCQRQPSALSSERLFGLLQVLVKLRRFRRLLDVAGNIEGIKLHVLEESHPPEIITFDDRVPDEHRLVIVHAVLMAVVHLRMTSIIEEKAFRRHLAQLIPSPHLLVSVIGRLYHNRHYEEALHAAQTAVEHTDEKVALLKLEGQCYERLGRPEEALRTYDHIISAVSEQDPTVWELKANLLYSLQREEDAIAVLAESQRFVLQHEEGGRPRPTTESAQLLQKLCRLLQREGRTQHYVQAAWRYVFLDSTEFFRAHKVRLCLEDPTVSAANFLMATDSLWDCLNRLAIGGSIPGSDRFRSVLPAGPSEPDAWSVMDGLLQLMLARAYDDKADQHSMLLVELLSQWGLVLQRHLNWNSTRRQHLSAIYISTAIINRIRDVGLRPRSSSKMISAELKNWKDKFGHSLQYWNLVGVYSHLAGNVNQRRILRSMDKARATYHLRLINAGCVVPNSTKLSLVVNGDLYRERPEDPQVCLQMAVTLINAAVSRVCRDSSIPLSDALSFLDRYQRAAGDCQEVYFNFGRAFHRFSELDSAIHMYERCLATVPVGATANERRVNDLSQEAAFNLALIYRSKNNLHEAARVTSTYLTTPD